MVIPLKALLIFTDSVQRDLFLAQRYFPDNVQEAMSIALLQSLEKAVFEKEGDVILVVADAFDEEVIRRINAFQKFQASVFPVIILLNAPSDALIVDWMKAGADSCIALDVRYQETLHVRVANELTRIQSTPEVSSLKLSTILEKVRQEAEITNIRKNQFLIHLSHELRTPLHTIISASSVCLEEMIGPLKPKQRDYLHLISQSGEHLLSLINEILDITRIESGKLVLNIETMDLSTFLNETVMLVKQLIQKKNQTLCLELVEPLPKSFIADSTRMKQILYNILTNAHQYSPTDTTIQLFCIQQGQYLVFQVIDRGIGIHEDDIERIIQPFEQGQPIEGERRRGIGLGLAIAQKMIELHHGKLEISSKPERGSKFSVFIPLVRTKKVRKSPKSGQHRPFKSMSLPETEMQKQLVLQDLPEPL